MKKKGQPEPTSEAQFSRVIGVDIGYGDVKGANNIHTMLMPSIVGAAPTVRYSDEWSRDDDGDIVHDNEGVWYVGEKALLHSKNVRYIKDRRRTVMGDYRRLVHVAFGRLHPHNDPDSVASISVATGLPVAHMADAPRLKELLEGQHRVHTRHANGVYSVENVAVMPQPYGTLFFNTLDEYGQLVNDELSSGKVVVIDTGRFTTNVITVQDMTYLERASSSVDAGVYVIEDHLRKHLNDVYDWSDPRPDVIRSVIQDEGHATPIDGNVTNLTDIVREGSANLAEQVVGLVSELVGGARDIKAMIITGGGGILLEDWIREAYPRAYLTGNPIMANALGFARYGRRKWVP